MPMWRGIKCWVVSYPMIRSKHVQRDETTRWYHIVYKWEKGLWCLIKIIEFDIFFTRIIFIEFVFSFLCGIMLFTWIGFTWKIQEKMKNDFFFSILFSWNFAQYICWWWFISSSFQEILPNPNAISFTDSRFGQLDSRTTWFAPASRINISISHSIGVFAQYTLEYILFIFSFLLSILWILLNMYYCGCGLFLPIPARHSSIHSFFMLNFIVFHIIYLFLFSPNSMNWRCRIFNLLRVGYNVLSVQNVHRAIHVSL